MFDIAELEEGTCVDKNM